MLKLNRLLYSTIDEGSFLHQIRPTPAQRSLLEDAKNDIRDHLRPRITEATKAVLGMGKSVEPRFRTQGSWRYKTCIQPACTPPQEMDWDFGVYLPVSVWEETGPPPAMAKLYFELVERLLTDLCEKKGWTLFSGKDTCIRVQLDDWAHIDIPLYAAPEREFDRIVEKAMMYSATYKSSRDVLVENFSDDELSQVQWEEMDGIAMATRSGDWKPTDPEAVARWFLDLVELHGDQLQRVCRYLKAWRDFVWQSGDGPTSVCIMIAVARSYEICPRRDDLALEKAARVLSEAIGGDVREEAIDGGIEDFNKRLDAENRRKASALAAKLADKLQAARMKRVFEKSEAISIMREQLGRRVPDSTELVDPDSGEAAVRTVAADRVTRPTVDATSAG